MRYRIGTVLLLVTVGLALSSCGNTFDGMGRDIERMGERIQSY